MNDRVMAVCSATFREAVRDKVLLTVVLFAVGMVLGSRVLGWLSIEDELKMVQDFSLSGISLLALFLAMLIGAGSLSREVERRTVYTVLSRTCRRGEFIVGKFLGLVGVFWCCVIGSTAVLAIWVTVWGGSIGAPLVAALIGLLLETLVLTSVALFLGSLAAPAIASVGTFVFYLAGHGTEAMRELTSEGRNPDYATLFEILYRVIPNLENVSFISATTSGNPVNWGDLGFGAVSALCWTVAFLAGAAFLFGRREF